MVEYMAVIYKNARSKGFVANCMVKNIIGFGRTEEDAINNLKECIRKVTKIEANIKPMYGLLLAE